MKKWFMALALVLCLILCSFAAAESVQLGVCGVGGDHLSWTLDNNGVLTLTGSGRMMDYTADGTNHAPWADLRTSIQQIVLGEDVTGIGAHAFEGCVSLPQLIRCQRNMICPSCILPSKIQEEAGKQRLSAE